MRWPWVSAKRFAEMQEALILARCDNKRMEGYCEVLQGWLDGQVAEVDRLRRLHEEPDRQDPPGTEPHRFRYRKGSAPGSGCRLCGYQNWHAIHHAPEGGVLA